MQLKNNTASVSETIYDYTRIVLRNDGIVIVQDDNIITIVDKSELRTLISLLTAALQEYED